MPVALVLVGMGCSGEAQSDPSIVSTTSAITTLTISGAVTGPGGDLAGATIALTGGATATATTSAAGTYSFSVASGQTYTVAATLAGCTFSAPQTFSHVGVNHTANFTGTGASCGRAGGTAGAGGGTAGVGAAGAAGGGTAGAAGGAAGGGV
ncbi:MAG TPA: hypothetical protein VLA14_06120, partial [Polyangia bacterium]|nr:hypothetical protein [Polyangia bacterium]